MVSDREAVRIALFIAIRDEEDFLEAIDNTDDDELKKRTKENIRAFKRVLRKRYDWRPE